MGNYFCCDNDSGYICENCKERIKKNGDIFIYPERDKDKAVILCSEKCYTVYGNTRPIMSFPF